MTAGYKVVSARLPSEMVERIDAKAKAEGITRQQLLAAVIDLGMRGAMLADPMDSRVIGPLSAIGLLRKAQANSGDMAWAYRLLRDAIWDHLTALSGGKK